MTKRIDIIIRRTEKDTFKVFGADKCLVNEYNDIDSALACAESLLKKL